MTWPFSGKPKRAQDVTEEVAKEPAPGEEEGKRARKQLQMFLNHMAILVEEKAPEGHWPATDYIAQALLIIVRRLENSI